MFLKVSREGYVDRGHPACCVYRLYARIASLSVRCRTVLIQVIPDEGSWCKTFCNSCVQFSVLHTVRLRTKSVKFTCTREQVNFHFPPSNLLPAFSSAALGVTG